MTNEQILKEFIEMYNDNTTPMGYYAVFNDVNTIEIGRKGLPLIYKISLYDFLYNPRWKFAEIIWGKQIHKKQTIYFDAPLETKKCQICGEYGESCLPTDYCYEYHLQQMVLCKDKFKYLEKFL